MLRSVAYTFCDYEVSCYHGYFKQLSDEHNALKAKHGTRCPLLLTIYVIRTIVREHSFHSNGLMEANPRLTQYTVKHQKQ